MTRTIRPTTAKRGVTVWQTATDDSVYRILERDGLWRLKRRSRYGGPWYVVEMPVEDFLQVHWLTLVA